MNGELAQSVVLVAFGNAYLNSPHRAPVESSLANLDLFPFVRTIQFGEAPALPPNEAALKWFRKLKSRGATRTWLVDVETGEPAVDGASRRELEGFSNENPRGIQVDFPSRDGASRRELEGFSNENPRGIQVDFPSRHEMWMPHWHFGRGQRWVVNYQRFNLQNPKAETNPKVEQAVQLLARRLRSARNFASKAKLDYWAKVFATGLTVLRNPHPKTEDSEGLRDVLPNRAYRETSRRLLIGASIADVFGGMGSWNDIWFGRRGRQAAYERVSERLYQAVMNAVVVAANAFNPYPIPEHWTSAVINLAKSMQEGADCAFALHDALIESGSADLAEHFVSRRHPTTCWALHLILRPSRIPCRHYRGKPAEAAHV